MCDKVSAIVRIISVIIMKVQVAIFLCCIFLAAVNAGRVRMTNNGIASADEFLYQVSLQVDGKHVCGGALVSDKHVVTAAHCVYDIILKRMPKERMKISVGSNNVQTGTKVAVERLAVSGGYQPAKSLFDIAVITLKTPVTESDTVKPISLPTGEVTLTDQNKLVVSGFGSKFADGPTSTVLKKMTMRVLSRAECRQFWKQLVPTHMCAVAAIGHGTCSGDSGGPLTLDNQVLVGIVSGGNPSGCGAGGGDLFTKVAPALNFIKQEMART